MSKLGEDIYVGVVGSADFRRRMLAETRRVGLLNENQLSLASPAEARASILTEKPDILIYELGLRTTKREMTWVRAFLQQARDRFKDKLYIVLAVSTPEKLAFAGSLLFEEGTSLEAANLIDNFIIAPPPGIPGVLTLEQQFVDCLDYAAGEVGRRLAGAKPLPTLSANEWVPALCDSESRNVWMRWLPRYATYVNENPIIVGATGTGKTKLAQAIHHLSGREGPFVSITPRDFSSNELVQAELFGAVAGAYTGAVEKWGLVKRAEKGTLFIDELQSIDLDLQGKLITFIENKSYRRVGEAESHTADVRFVFATNRTLQDLVDEGSLRDDFAYRLERLQITLPSLHQRRLDIAAGIALALAKVLRERHGTQTVAASDANEVEGLTIDAYRVLFSASWPGNLRQLENSIAKLIELADIKNLRLIDSSCTGGALEGMLGRTEAASSDVYERAAIDIALKATTEGFESLSDCLFSMADNARARALELSGGDTDKAADMIQDSAKAMNLYSATRGVL